MSCWRVLELSDQPDGEHVPQLLVKPVFSSTSYTVHLTDLSNIWSEELALNGIVARAAAQQSPIEVSKQDTSQLAILLDNVRRSLEISADAACRLARSVDDGVTLQTIISLPEPLGCLTWKFCLEKRTPTVLKNELILPLLVSSHIQHERITGLISTITDKDKALTRLIDQYESSNLNLAAAFPSMGASKPGRKVIKREQAARHVPALQPFREEPWRRATEQLQDPSVTTLGLFQEALAQSTPNVPAQLKSEEQSNAWWTMVPSQLSQAKPPKIRAKKTAPKPKVDIVESSEDETEDEFETHENFKTRAIPSKSNISPDLSPSVQNGKTEDDDESTEDEDDLDHPIQSQSQSQKHTRVTQKSPPQARSPSPEDLPAPKVETQPEATSKRKGFRIGGKAKEVIMEPSLPPQPQHNDAAEKDIASSPPQEVPEEVGSTPRKVRRPFKIGGKGKSTNVGGQEDGNSVTTADKKKTTQSPKAETPASLPRTSIVKEATPEKAHDETPEEKAERKRAELKRKNDEAAKKQAQSKKKKRF